MKILSVLSMVLLTGFMLHSCKSTVKEAESSGEATTSFEIPENVMAVLDQSCYGCHNSESQNDKGKEKLAFDEMASLKTFVLAGTLKGIQEQVDSQKMPPEKFLEKYPDRALSVEQKELLITWAAEAVENLTEE